MAYFLVSHEWAGIKASEAAGLMGVEPKNVYALLDRFKHNCPFMDIPVYHRKKVIRYDPEMDFMVKEQF